MAEQERANDTLLRLEDWRRTSSPTARGASEAPHRFRQRCLLLDWTKFGGGSATGELKATYFEGLGADQLQHVYWAATGKVGIAPGGDHKGNGARILPADHASLLELTAEFDPHVIVYRPVADKPEFHQAAMRIIGALNRPYVIWLMDDWPERLRESGDPLFTTMDADLRLLLTHAADRFAISEAMARAFQVRYGSSFAVFRNGVLRSDWDGLRKQPSPDGSLRVRYAGNLAPDMASESVLDIAQTVEDLSARHAVKFEIRTQPYWARAQHERYADLKHTVIDTSELDLRGYRQWLVDADVLVMAYNFDPKTVLYLGYSFANKTPECFASGAPVLAYGPHAIATLAFLADRHCAEVVDRRDTSTLRSALERLLIDERQRSALAASGRELAHTLFDLSAQRARFFQALRVASARSIHKDFTRAMRGAIAHAGAPKPVAHLLPSQRRRFPVQRPIVLLGNDASLRGLDETTLFGFDTLGLDGGVRRWARSGFEPTYYACLDTPLGLSHRDAIATLARPGTATRQLLLKEHLRAALGSQPQQERILNFERMQDAFEALSGPFVTSASHAAIWAALLGYRDIILLGVDGQDTDDAQASAVRREAGICEIVAKPNNAVFANDDYLTYGDRFTESAFSGEAHAAWRSAAATLARMGVSVWNASVSSPLTLFPMRALETFAKPRVTSVASN